MTPRNRSKKTIIEEKEEEKSLLHRHRPFYFAYGSPDTKVQVSFKLQLANKLPLYFGYTQFMFWALEEHSVPFRDITFNPELFYRIHTKGAGALHSIDIGPHNHNSNGKGGTASRAYNGQYVRFNFESKGDQWMTRANLQLSAYHTFDHGNKDIQQYVGPASLNLSFVQLFDGWFDKSEITLMATPGGRWMDHWDRGGYQLSWSFRLGAINLTPSFYFQYYHGYAESLLNYDKMVDQFRGGIIF